MKENGQTTKAVSFRGAFRDELYNRIRQGQSNKETSRRCLAPPTAPLMQGRTR